MVPRATTNPEQTSPTNNSGKKIRLSKIRSLKKIGLRLFFFLIRSKRRWRRYRGDIVMALYSYGPTWLWPYIVMVLYSYGPV